MRFHAACNCWVVLIVLESFLLHFELVILNYIVFYLFKRNITVHRAHLAKKTFRSCNGAVPLQKTSIFYLYVK